MNLYPVPQKIALDGHYLDYSSRRWILVPPGASFYLKDAARRTAETLSVHFVTPPAITAGIPGAGKVLARLLIEESIPAQGFILSATADGFDVSAGDEAGLYYALQAIEQILWKGVDRVPACEIHDQPDLRYRGYMLDVSRCKVPTMESLKSLIDALSKLRYNELQLYMEHSFEFAGDERVWFDNSPLTAAEIIELDEYCRSRFMELVPNLNSFGHLERWLRIQEYRDLAESKTPWYNPNVDWYYQGVLAPDDKALAFVERLYAEFLPNFSCTRFNIGCDETNELGKGRSAAVCAERGTTRVYLDFVLKIAELAKKHGRSPMFWGDIIMNKPELIDELPKEIIALEWGYEANHPFEADTAKFQQAQVPFYVCPGTSSWNSVTGRTANMLGNIRNAAQNGNQAGALGLLMTDWGDGGHLQYYPMSWCGLTYAAGCAWNANVDSESDLAAAVGWAFLPDTGDSRLGEFLLELGRIPDAFHQSFHNCTPFFMALFRPRWKLTQNFLDQTTVAEVRDALRRLAAWKRAFVRKPPLAPRLVLDELAATADLAEVALKRMLQAKGGKINLGEWRDQLRHIIGCHNDLWLARNRAGGLFESSTALRKQLEETL